MSRTADVRTSPRPPLPPTHPEHPGDQHHRRLPPGLRYCAFVYALTRVPAVLALVVYLARHPRSDAASLAAKWDGWWYVRIAAHGYSSSLRPPLERATDWHHNFSEWAFLPGYPALIAAVHGVTRVPLMVSAVGLSLVLGLLAVWAVHRLGAAYGGERVARGAALLVAAWPGSAVFGQPYADGLFIAAAAASLTMLIHHRWAAAGALGAVACLTRPNGLAVVAAAGAVAVVHLVRWRQVRQFAAPLLGAAGAGAFVAYGWLRTGDPLVWRHAENLWTQHFDLSHRLIKTWLAMRHSWPTAMRTQTGQAVVAGNLVMIAATVPLVVLAVTVLVLRRRLCLPLAVYTAITLVMIIGYSGVGPRPRIEIMLFPAAVWAAAWWPRRLTTAVAVASTPLIGLLTYLWLWRVTP